MVRDCTSNPPGNAPLAGFLLLADSHCPLQRRSCGHPFPVRGKRAMLRPGARQRGYNSQWDKERKAFLAGNPWCARCAKRGLRVAATVVDHIKPHRGDKALFWDKSNWQPLDQHCHNSLKQRQENGRIIRAIGADGWPVD